VEVWSGSFTVRQTIWDFGRTTNRYQAAVAASRQSLAQQQLTEELVDLGAEAAFRTAIAAGELVAAMEEAQRTAQAHLSLAKGRSEVGLGAAYDVSRAEVEVANAEVLLVQATNARDLAFAQLAYACGLETLSNPVELVQPSSPEIAELPAFDAALQESMATLPEIRAARAQVEVAEQQLDSAWSELFPSIGATGTMGLRGTNVTELTPGWTGIVSLSVPLINGGADLARIREARANLAAAEASLERTNRALRLDLEAGMLAVTEGRARLQAATRKESAADEGLRLAEARYQTGLGSALELADAQSNLAAARAERVRSALDLAVSTVNLERLLGRWSSDA
jgi:outer membrane protein